MYPARIKFINIFSSLISALIFIHLLAKTVIAQVVINEVLPNPTGDDDGAEWVELYNLNQEIAPLSECVLYLHETNNNQKVVFDSEDFIDKFKAISWDGSWLNNGGDKVRFECGSYNDSLSYGDTAGSVVSEPDEGESIGRNPDGTGNFSLLASVTLNGPNSLPPTPTPAPTATFTPTTKPTKAPTSTSTPKPTQTPTLDVKTKSNIPTSSTGLGDEEGKNISLDNNENQTEVLGIQEADALSLKLTPTPSDDEEKGGKRFPLLAGIFILVGIGLVGFAIYPIFIKRRLGYNLEDEEGS